jgi:hypothetical protein
VLALKAIKNLPPPPARNFAREASSRSRLMGEVVMRPGSKDLLIDWDPPDIALDPPPRSASRALIDDPSAWEERLRKQLSYQREMKIKYERLAGKPWLPVTPDPRPPR